MSSLCSNNVIKSDYVKIKGRISLNNFNFGDKHNSVTEKEIENDNEPKFDISKIEEEINQKIAEAQKKHDEILTLANQERERILSKCQDKALDIEKKAYNEGYEQGVKNGYEDGYKEAYEDNIEKARHESSEIIERANKIMFDANKEIASYIKDNKKNILAISICIAEKVLRTHFEDEASMDALLLDIIKEYELKENFIVKVNHIYKESLDKQIIVLKENKSINNDVFIVSDDSIEKGNAVIENVRGRLIVGIDDVIEKIKEELI